MEIAHFARNVRRCVSRLFLDRSVRFFYCWLGLTQLFARPHHDHALLLLFLAQRQKNKITLPPISRLLTRGNARFFSPHRRLCRGTMPRFIAVPLRAYGFWLNAKKRKLHYRRYRGNFHAVMRGLFTDWSA